MSVLTDQQAGFLEVICADPHDIVVRLVYSDWLEEHGQHERAEFCRVQCELASWPCECDSEERVYHSECQCDEKQALLRREQYSLGWGGVRWLKQDLGKFAECLRFRGVGTLQKSFRRGFVERVQCCCEDWLEHGPAVVRANPILEAELTDWDQRRNEHGSIPHWLENPVAWARGSHPDRGLEALLPLGDIS